MLRHFPLSLCLLLLTLCSQCKQNDPTPEPPTNPVDQLPPATQTGQRIFGCLLNGQAWNLAGSPFSGPLFTAQYASGHLRLGASGLTTDGTSSGGVIQIGIDNLTAVGRYTLMGKDTRFVGYDDARTNCLYYTTAWHPATIDITRLDLVNRIVAGRFSFTLETPGCGQVVVTDGRFDSRF